jgi:putative holliday junction resolvase
MAGAAGTLLAFDYGRRRIGMAVGNTLTRKARALLTLELADTGPDWPRIEALVREWQPVRLVVGVPYNADGSEGELAAEAQRFARRLAGRCGIPVDTIDERLTSVEAEDRLTAARRAGRGRAIAKADVDSAAAAVILQSWLDNNP